MAASLRVDALNETMDAVKGCWHRENADSFPARHPARPAAGVSSSTGSPRSVTGMAARIESASMALSRMLALALAIPLVAQATQRHLWASVRAISVGSRVSVRTLDKSWVPQGEELVKGTLESVSEDSLVVRAGV